MINKTETAYISSSSLFNDKRLILFKAIQEKRLEEVKSILEAIPELINAKTTTRGSSLLHIAVEGKNPDSEICLYLLKKQHTPNPIDKEGKTPYQRTKSKEIKKLLVEAQTTFLIDKYYTMKKNSGVSACTILNRQEYIDFGLKLGMKEKSQSSFGFTDCEYKDSIKIRTYFREDILMTPYYCDLLVIHENEQVRQLVELNVRFDNIRYQ